MEALIENIAKALVEHPEEVVVEAFDEGGETVLELRVSPDDLGRVIGRQGRTARSIRAILAAAGLKQHKRYSLEIVE
jgi:predicted RNA-binding protein YlqC (UPF0109 family)